MMNKVRISGKHFEELKKHLFPGDNKEAVALAICGRSLHNEHQTLLVKQIFPIPYDHCFERTEDFVHWPTDFINPLLEEASKKGFAILKIHCHPGGYDKFSQVDDESDQELFTSIHAWLGDDLPHGSCVMLPDGSFFGRFFFDDMSQQPIHQFSIAGNEILNWYYSESDNFIESTSQIRNQQAFGQKTVNLLNRLKIGIVGCSGTGSPVIEQLKRLGVGEFVLVDPDFIDSVNLNRIVGSTNADSKLRSMKVDVMKNGIDSLGIGTKTTCFSRHITNIEVVKELADCDVLFGCVDGAEGRHMLNLISSYYLIPFIDIGVKFDADGMGGINGIFGSVHYVQPFGSSLLSRKQYTIEKLKAEETKRIDAEEYKRNQYLANVNESNPAVISVNMQVAALGVNELLARMHPYRNFENGEIEVIRVNFTESTTLPEEISNPCLFFGKNAGRGDVIPLLNYAEFSNNVT